MSLLGVVDQGVETAFRVASEFVVVGEYLRHTGGGIYDPDTDSLGPAAVVIPNVRFLKTSADIQEREASPLSINDVKFIVPARDLPGLKEPGENDQIRAAGTLYNVIVSRFVPGNVVHVIFGRRA